MIAGLIFMIFYNAFLLGIFFLSAGKFKPPFRLDFVRVFCLD